MSGRRPLDGATQVDGTGDEMGAPRNLHTTPPSAGRRTRGSRDDHDSAHDTRSARVVGASIERRGRESNP